MSDLTVSLGLDAAGFVSGMRDAGQMAEKGATSLSNAYRRAAAAENGLTDKIIQRRAQTMRNLGVADTEIAKFVETAQSIRRYKEELARVGAQYQGNAAGLAEHMRRFGEQNQLLSFATIRTRELAAEQAAAAAKANNQAAANRNLSNSLGSVTQQMRQLAAVGLGFAGLAGLTSNMDDWTTLNNRLKLVTDSTRELTEVRARLFDIGRDTGQSVSGLSELYTRLHRSQQQTGLSAQQMLTVTDVLAKAMAVGGGTADANARAIEQLGQALSLGTLRGQDLNSILSQSPGIAQAVAKGLGVSTGELKRLGNEGRLTAETVSKAILASQNEIEAAYKQTSGTISGSMQVLRDSVMRFVGQSSDASGAAKILSGGILTLANNIDLVAGAAAALAGIALAKWLVGGSVSLAIMAANGLLAAQSLRGGGAAALWAALGFSRAGTAAAGATGSVTTLAGAMAVFSASARGAAAAANRFAGSSMGGFAAQAAAMGAAVYTSTIALDSLFNLLNGRDASNSISRSFDGLLDQLGLLDAKTETLGTRLYDILNAKPNSDTQHLLQLLAGPANYLYKRVSGNYDEYASMGNSRSRVDGGAALAQSSIAALAAAGKSLSELDAAIDETVAKYREQAEAVGSSNNQLTIQRLEAQREAAMAKHRAEIDKMVGLSEEQKRDKLAATLDSYNAKIEEARAAMDKLARHEAAEKLSGAISKTADEYERQAAVFGKTAHEVALMDLHANRAALNLQDLSQSAAQAAEADYHRAKTAIEMMQKLENQQAIDNTLAKLEEQALALGKSESELLRLSLAAKGATDGEIRKAQAMQGVIDQYRKQEQVMSSLADLDKQVAQLGMSEIERQLDDLRRKGATGEQLAHARRQLESLAEHKRAADGQRNAALLQNRGAADMLSAGGSMKTAAQMLQEGAIKFDGAAGRFGVDQSKTEPARREVPQLGYYTGGGFERMRRELTPSKSYKLELAGPDGGKMSGNMVTTDNLEGFFDALLTKKARQVAN